MLVVSLLLLSFVVHVALVSGLQHQRDQRLAYDELRTTLAKAETPIGQLGVDETMTPLGTPIALLQIPALDLEEVVMEGTTGEVLRSGAGHRRDSVFPGQAGTSIVLGRQLGYGGPFGDLTRLQPGNEIRVTTGQGEHSYRVLGLRRAGDPLPTSLTADQGRLELQTADGLAMFPSGVLYVDAELMTSTQQTPSRVLGTAALPADELAMGQQQRGWSAMFVALIFFVAAGVGVWWLWRTWGRWQAWVIGVPLLLCLGVVVADATMDALPNLL